MSSHLQGFGAFIFTNRSNDLELENCDDTNRNNINLITYYLLLILLLITILLIFGLSLEQLEHI